MLRVVKLFGMKLLRKTLFGIWLFHSHDSRIQFLHPFFHWTCSNTDSPSYYHDINKGQIEFFQDGKVEILILGLVMYNVFTEQHGFIYN